jgi:hypothetical protein
MWKPLGCQGEENEKFPLARSTFGDLPLHSHTQDWNVPENGHYLLGSYGYLVCNSQVGQQSQFSLDGEIQKMKN